MREAAAILLERKGRFLVAADAMTERFLETLPQNKTLRARTITVPRSRPRLRLYWSLLHVVSDNLENVSDKALHEWIKMQLGLVEAVPLKSGKVDLVPGSISFEAMGEEEFVPFLDKTIDLLVGKVIPGLGKEELMEMATAMLGGRG